MLLLFLFLLPSCLAIDDAAESKASKPSRYHFDPRTGEISYSPIGRFWNPDGPIPEKQLALTSITTPSADDFIGQYLYDDGDEYEHSYDPCQSTDNPLKIATVINSKGSRDQRDNNSSEESKMEGDDDSELAGRMAAPVANPNRRRRQPMRLIADENSGEGTFFNKTAIASLLDVTLPSDSNGFRIYRIETRKGARLVIVPIEAK